MREAWLIRHAETEWSRSKRHTGLTDVPLTEAGREHARALRAKLGARAWAAVLTSPLARAHETCELAGLGERAVVDADLVEWDYGDYEGITSAQIRETRPDWDLWRDGCPAGEAPGHVAARADRVLARLLAVDGDVAVFGHGHALRMLGARWIELEPAAGGRLALDTGAVCVLGFEHGRRVLWRWNRA